MKVYYRYCSTGSSLSNKFKCFLKKYIPAFSKPSPSLSKIQPYRVASPTGFRGNMLFFTPEVPFQNYQN